jgi:pimeloyl-ACP methyl ester carboxylesterase
MRPEREEAATARPTIIGTRRGTVECARTGEGPAVLLLHGAMGGYDQGLILGRSAVGSPAFEYVAVSRPGYLGTPLALGEAPEEQADLCAALLDALAVPQAGVIAISGGGQCALQFALRHPDRCRCLVMISACSAPIAVRLPLQFHLLGLMARVPALTSRMRKRLRTDPERAVRRSIPDPQLRVQTLNDPEAGPLLLALQESTLDRLAERLPGTRNDIAQSRAAFAYPVEQISGPLLVVHGTADRAAPFAQARQLAARVPGAELLAIEGGEHVSIFTHRNVIRPRVERFLCAHLPEEPKPPVPRTESAV